ncbi:RagB/SusD family nutrient uptake outer membrane protein [uncultured Bacteroides sp.]|uniref:RagB/SusD family nutrient uptake outer membrane protein n=1 Tax=uncultured Bacteroides sp. TaxID=162156 RepID=UPI002AAB46AC|nr:RagB/SusD family nutrient uptake outer membrane protein [uncultured Bacteroides sp.]
MKKIVILSLIISIFFSLTSCEGNLEPTVYNRLSTSNFPKTEEDCRVIVTGVYAQFHFDNAWYRYSCDPQSRLVLGEIGTDELYMPWSWCQVPNQNFDFNPGYDLFSNFYQKMVPSVTKATYALTVLESSQLADTTLKQRYIAEIKCCRAMWMYDLEGFYGPPPVVLDPQAVLNPTKLYFPPRLSESEYLTFLENDLLSSMDVLPIKYSSNSDYGRFTKGAAASILMKLYMRHKEFSKAEGISRKIMTYGYKLESDYSKIWDISNEMNAELIFVLPAPEENNTSSNIYRAHVLPSDWVSLSGAKVVAYDGYRIPWNVYDKFDKDDSRLSTLIKDYYVKSGNVVKLVDGRKTGRLKKGAIPLKYGEDPSSDGLFCGNDIVLIRYADILLLRAEALNELNGPNQESVDLINQIRDRAFKNDPAKRVSLTQFISKESLRDYILQERQFELLFEGERREDLIRQGKYIQFAKERGVTGAEDYKVRYPMPSSVIIEGQGNIKQNDGY